MNTQQRSDRQRRLNTLLRFDRNLLKDVESDIVGIIGVDEVGRGSLIGPVVAAALVLPTEIPRKTKELLLLLDDSKAAHLNHEKRVALSAALKELGAWGIGEASQKEVEDLNVAQASLLAAHRAIEMMQSAFTAIDIACHQVIIDGKCKMRSYLHPQRAVVKADSLSAAVAGASILAKAHRDGMIHLLAKEYPGYGWETNVGYNCPGHKRAILSLGVTPHHRKTFTFVRNILEPAEQMELAL